MLLIAVWISGISWVIFSVMYGSGGVDTSLDNRLLGLRTHIGFLEVIALYIAWRITPDSKSQP